MDGDGFSIVFAHCEVKSLVVILVEINEAPDFSFASGPALCSTRDGRPHAKKKREGEKLRDFFHQDGLGSAGPLG
jgi:hypothetical protein